MCGIVLAGVICDREWINSLVKTAKYDVKTFPVMMTLTKQNIQIRHRVSINKTAELR